MTDSAGGVVFLFSPEGGEHARMGRTLAGRYPAFAAAVLDTSDAVVAAGGPRVWTPRHGFRHPGGPQWPDRRQRDPVFAQTALFTHQVATATLLTSWGVRPDAVIGHGIGEVAAAVTAGALPLSDAVRVVLARGRAARRGAQTDVVAELQAPVPDVRRLVDPVREQVTVAAVHGPRSVLVSGPPRYIDAVVRRAGRRDIPAWRCDRFAPAICRSAAATESFAALGPLHPTTPDIPMYSTVRRGAIIDAPITTGSYWIENFTEPVQFAAALDRAAGSDTTIVLEVAPHPILCDVVRELPRFTHTTYPTACDDDEGTTFLTCLAQVQAIRATTPHRTRQLQESFTGRRPYAGTGNGRTQFGGGYVIASTPATSAGTGASEETAAGLSTGRDHQDPEVAGIGPVRGDMRAEATAAGTLASIRPTDNLPPTDIIAWTRMVDANRAIRFLAAQVALDPPMQIDTAGTYVVSGGLGALGSVIVRRLLASGARDVLVPTRSPRPVPPLLDGFEDRVVVVRCDTADRHDLDNALRDIRESGCTIRGVVHAAQVFEDTVVAALSANAVPGSARIGPAPPESPEPALDAGRLARRFARISPAAANLIELTAADPVTFFAVFSTPFGGIATSREINTLTSVEALGHDSSPGTENTPR
ncbi:acyltransferase domain-containing protein [Nocardia speluncae]|uniref:Acyltransferase domain-containing protein n=1 Tax=Nocardia speluncae TaxID=419477 RepID=A0A846XPA7_9NOCA|nr:acyltransferase domain-containing protein [Nocardia speluncae]NKY36363.1 acyltransferase domain-containing protein [Nocardia speluncae]